VKNEDKNDGNQMLNFYLFYAIKDKNSI